MTSMIEQLMDLPLFKGAGLTKMSKVIGEAKLHFLKYPAGETIIEAGDKCEHITFILSGSVRSTIENNNGRFAVSQTLTAPAMITPAFLFGRYTTYPCSVRAIDSVSILQLSKNDFIKNIEADDVFLFNFLNNLSFEAQKGVAGLMALTTADVAQRIAFWISALTQREGTDIVLTCRRRDLCSLFNIQRNTFEAVLDKMTADGILSYDNQSITILDHKHLMRLLDGTHSGY